MIELIIILLAITFPFMLLFYMELSDPDKM
jgi:hypothetical protein